MTSPAGRVVSVVDFCATSTISFDWIVPGRVPKPAMILVAGEPKAGKSYLMVDVANAIAGGGLVFGTRARPARVLYLTTDAREAVWKNFFQELIDAGVEFHPNFQLVASSHWHRPANVLSEATFEWTRLLLEEAQPDVVVLDVLRDYHNGDENDSTSMKLVFDRLERLFKNVCLFLVHHAKKVPDDVADPKPQNYIRGSSYVMGKVDDLWFLHSKPGSDHGTLRIDGRMGGAAIKLAGTRLPSGMWVWPQAEEMRSKAQACADLCTEFPTYTHSQLAPIVEERLKISRSTYFRYMKTIGCAHKPDQSPMGQNGQTISSPQCNKENEELTLRAIFGNLVHIVHDDFAQGVEGGEEPEVEAPVDVQVPTVAAV